MKPMPNAGYAEVTKVPRNALYISSRFMSFVKLRITLGKCFHYLSMSLLLKRNITYHIAHWLEFEQALDYTRVRYKPSWTPGTTGAGGS